MYEKTLVHKTSIKWEQKYNKLKKKYDKLACHIIVNKMLSSNAKQYSGNAVRVDVSITVYPSDAENRLSYDDFIQNVTSERIKSEYMKIYYNR